MAAQPPRLERYRELVLTDFKCSTEISDQHDLAGHRSQRIAGQRAQSNIILNIIGGDAIFKRQRMGRRSSGSVDEVHGGLCQEQRADLLTRLI